MPTPKLSEIPATWDWVPGEVGQTYTVKARLELTEQLDCIPEALEDTVLHARQEIWQSLYGEILCEVNEFIFLAIKSCPVEHFEQLSTKSKALLGKLTPTG